MNSPETERLEWPPQKLEPRLSAEGLGQHRHLHLPWIDRLRRELSFGQGKVIVDRLMEIHEIEDLLGRLTGLIKARSVQVIGRGLRLKSCALRILAGGRGRVLD